MTELPTTDKLLRPAEARSLLSGLLGRVVPVSTFGCWARGGHLEAAELTAGGHRRFRADAIRAFFERMLPDLSAGQPGAAPA